MGSRLLGKSILNPPENILLIIRRSPGDALVISPGVDILTRRFPHAAVDLFVNEDPAAATGLLDGVSNIIPFDDNLLARRPAGVIAMQLTIGKYGF